MFLDKNNQLVIQSRSQTRLSLEKLEAVNIWPESENNQKYEKKSQKYEKSLDSVEKPKENSTQHRLLQLQMAASTKESEENNDESTDFKSWSEQAMEWENYEGLMRGDCVANSEWNQGSDYSILGYLLTYIIY